MKYIISGTDRADSNTLKISQHIQRVWKDIGENVEIIDLKDIKEALTAGPHYGTSGPDKLTQYLEKILHAEGLIVVTPEYNGSMPGILKYFIDHMKFPESFEFRPVCFVGLGGRFGALRPVEHLQGVFGYRNAFIYPERVFLMNVWTLLKEGQLQDPVAADLLKKQAVGFKKFCEALNYGELDANSVLRQKASAAK